MREVAAAAEASEEVDGQEVLGRRVRILRAPRVLVPQMQPRAALAKLPERVEVRRGRKGGRQVVRARVQIPRAVSSKSPFSQRMTYAVPKSS